VPPEEGGHSARRLADEDHAGAPADCEIDRAALAVFDDPFDGAVDTELERRARGDDPGGDCGVPLAHAAGDARARGLEGSGPDDREEE